MQRPRDRSEGRSEDHISRAEAFQPDPQLQLSEGRASGLQIALIAFACMLVVGMMIYGLNQPTSDGNVTASAPAAQTTGTAPPAPQTGEDGSRSARSARATADAATDETRRGGGRLEALVVQF